MKFYDTVNIKIQSGRGGDGCVSARREAGVPYGGPAGGNGGVGGSVIFQANAHLTTLVNFRPGKLYQGDDGMPGRTKEQDGKNAESLILEVPIGTIIINRQNGVIVGQVMNHGEQFVSAQGGRSGIGNMHFKSSTRQYPNFALKGEPGIFREIKLELQLIADIALIGTPSVGKSSIINTLAHTRAKVADYPFTTLVPNLGTVQTDGRNYHVIDIPGLIEGAHTGKGLGNTFLRHILKAHILAIVLDIGRFDIGIQEFSQTMDELISYIKERYNNTPEFGEQVSNITIQIVVDEYIRLQIYIDTSTQTHQLLFEKIIQVIINKNDLISDVDILEEYKKELLDHMIHYLQPYCVDVLDAQYVKKHIHCVSTMLPGACDKLKGLWSDIIGDQHIYKPSYIDQVIGANHGQPQMSISIKNITNDEIGILIQQGYIQPEQSKYIQVWSIVHPEICRLANILPWSNDQAEQRFWKQCMRQKIINRWAKNGVVVGDVFKIISLYPGTDDMYITYE